MLVRERYRVTTACRSYLRKNGKIKTTEGTRPKIYCFAAFTYHIRAVLYGPPSVTRTLRWWGRIHLPSSTGCACNWRARAWLYSNSFAYHGRCIGSISLWILPHVSGLHIILELEAASIRRSKEHSIEGSKERCWGVDITRCRSLFYRHKRPPVRYTHVGQLV